MHFPTYLLVDLPGDKIEAGVGGQQAAVRE
jgi:hypothetical protein